MKTYQEDESSVFGVEAGSAFSSTMPVTALPGMQVGKEHKSFTEDFPQKQLKEGEDNNKKGEIKPKTIDAGRFIFSDPKSRWFELSQFAEGIIDKRIEKADLLRLSGIYKIKEAFADEVANTILREESEQGKLYSTSEARRRVHTFINVRIPTWLDSLRKQDLAAGIDSSDTTAERNEEGDVVDFGQVYHEEVFAEDRKNPFHQDQLEVMIAKEEELVLERALSLMTKKKTKRCQQYLAIIGKILNRTDLADEIELIKLTEIQRNTLKHHAIKRLATIMAKLYPVPKTRKKKSRSTLEVMISNLKPEVIEQALMMMAEKRTRKTLQYLAVIGKIINNQEMDDGSYLDGLTNIQLNTLKNQAMKRLTTIIKRLYPKQTTGGIPSAKKRRLTYQDLKVSYRKTTPLFNEVEKNGEVIIVFSRDHVQSTNIYNADENGHSSQLNQEDHEIQEISKVQVKTRQTLMGKTPLDGAKKLFTQAQYPCTQYVIDQTQQPEQSDEYPAYDDAA